MMIRTTVRFDEELFKDARKKAIDQGVAFAEIINKALRNYLKADKHSLGTIVPKKAKTAKFELKVYNIGQIKGSLRRKDLYEDL